MRGSQHPFDSMDRLFDQMRREMFGVSPELAATADEAGAWDAGISIEETDDGFAVFADVPGFDRDELSVRLHEDVLHLDGEHEVDDGVSYRSRRVSERVSLPAPPDTEQVTASYHNGVLEIRFVVDDDGESGIDIHIE